MDTGFEKYSRANCDSSFKGVEDIIELALGGMTVESIRKFFKKMIHYIEEYREGITIGPLMDVALKKYKSQRKIRENDI